MKSHTGLIWGARTLLFQLHSEAVGIVQSLQLDSRLFKICNDTLLGNTVGLFDAIFCNKIKLKEISSQNQEFSKSSVRYMNHKTSYTLHHNRTA